ncbi:uncharacterized protein LOC106092002 isoform X2 [Stomoxys calcitrans]|uniref:uncharacterized protein LOC106092002 isoform X2 n=1 Tax=Stomoxys calcitrans TaxID=35570 RepID=UPI0027E3924C|nr:uncharacterized protein LOC106092002 isoform X2 [Stomoxys calcitrans]
MELPSMVQRSGDTLIVRSVVSGNQLYMDQNTTGPETTNMNTSNNNSNSNNNNSINSNNNNNNNNVNSGNGMAVSVGGINIPNSAALLSNSSIMQQIERLKRSQEAAAAQQHLMQQQHHQMQQQQQQQLQHHQQNIALELKEEGLPQCKIKRNYSCSYCTYFTQNPRCHLTHLRDVHGEKIVINKCKLCLYASRHYQKLVRHMKMVHNCTDGVSSGHGQARGKRGMNRDRKRKLEDTLAVPAAMKLMNVEGFNAEQIQADLEQKIHRDLDLFKQQQQQQQQQLEDQQQKSHQQQQQQQQLSVSAAGALFAAAYEQQLRAQRELADKDALKTAHSNYERRESSPPAALTADDVDASTQQKTYDYTPSPQHQQQQQQQEPKIQIPPQRPSFELTPSPSGSNSSPPPAGQSTSGSTTPLSGVMPSDEPSNNRLMKCSLCDFTTLYRNNLLEHEIEDHCNAKFYRCEKCSYVTHIKARFSKHVKYHSMPMIKCVTCDFRTPYKWNLDRHMKNHGGAGPFRCAACDFTADIKQSLTVHEMNHHVPPVGHAAGMTLARRRNKVGGTDISEDFFSDSAEMLEDHFNNNNMDEYDEMLMTAGPVEGGMYETKRLRYEEDEPTDLSQKGGSSDTSSVHNHTLPKVKKPLPNLIPISKEGQNILNLTTDLAASRSSLSEIASIFFNEKQISEMLQPLDKADAAAGAASQLSPTTTINSSSAASSKSLLARKAGSFFDKIKSSTTTNENLICPCGHMAKCLSESIIHRKSCNFLPLSVNEDIDLDDEDHDEDDGEEGRLEIDFTEDDDCDKQSHSALNLSVTGSTRCQHCRHRCKSSADLLNHLKICSEANSRCGDSVSGESCTGSRIIMGSSGGDGDGAGGGDNHHPMENRVFVWNKLPRNQEGSQNFEGNRQLMQQGQSSSHTGGSSLLSSNNDENSYYGVETAPGYGEMTPEEEAANSSLKKVYKCPHCSFWASTASRFHVHIVGHLNKKPFECSLCSYRSNWRWDITKHIRLKTIRDPSHKNARVLMNDETGRRNYTKYNKYITLMKVTEEDGDPKLMKSGEMTPNQVASLAFINDYNSKQQQGSISSSGSTPIANILNGVREDITLEPIPSKSAMGAGGGGGDEGMSDNFIRLPLLASMMNAAIAQQQHQKNHSSNDHETATLITPSVTISAVKKNPHPSQSFKPSDEIILEVRPDSNEKNYKCRKCSFRHMNRDAVLAHVKVHFPDPNMPIVTATATTSPKAAHNSPLQVSVNNSNSYMNKVLAAMCLSQQQPANSANAQLSNLVAAGLLDQAAGNSPLSGLALALAGKSPLKASQFNAAAAAAAANIIEHGEQKAILNDQASAENTMTSPNQLTLVRALQHNPQQQQQPQQATSASSLSGYGASTSKHSSSLQNLLTSPRGNPNDGGVCLTEGTMVMGSSYQKTATTTTLTNMPGLMAATSAPPQPTTTTTTTTPSPTTIRHCRLKHAGVINIETLDRAATGDRHAAPIYKPLVNGALSEQQTQSLSGSNNNQYSLTLKALQQQQQNHNNNMNNNNNNNTNVLMDNNNQTAAAAAAKLSISLPKSETAVHSLLHSPLALASGPSQDLQAAAVAYLAAAYKAAAAQNSSNPNATAAATMASITSMAEELLLQQQLQKNDQIEITRVSSSSSSANSNNLQNLNLLKAAANNTTAVNNSNLAQLLESQSLNHAASGGGHVTNASSSNNNQNAKSKQQKCPLCPYICDSKSQMNYHISLHKPTQYECHLCTFVCAKKQHLSSHLRTVHQLLPQQQQQALAGTNSLSMDFSLALKMAAAAKSQQDPPLAIDLSGIKHIASSVSSPAQQRSNTVAASTSAQHQTQQLPPEYQYRSIFYCNKCPARYAQKHSDPQTAKIDLDDHLRQHEPLMTSSSSSSSNSGNPLEDNRKYQCEYCDYRAAHESLIQAHRNVHTTQYQEKCNELYKNCKDDPVFRAPKLMHITATRKQHHHQQHHETIWVVDQDLNENPTQPTGHHMVTKLGGQNSAITSSSQGQAFEGGNSLLKKQLESKQSPPLAVGAANAEDSESKKILPEADESNPSASTTASGATSEPEADHHAMDKSPHDNADQEDEAAAEAKERCQHCPFESSHATEFKTHIQQHIAVSQQRLAYTCEHCDYTAEEQEQIEEHTRVHFNSMEKLKEVAFFTSYDKLELSMEQPLDEGDDDADADAGQQPHETEEEGVNMNIIKKEVQSNNGNHNNNNNNNNDEDRVNENFKQSNDEAPGQSPVENSEQQPPQKCAKIILYKNDGCLTIKKETQESQQTANSSSSSTSSSSNNNSNNNNNNPASSQNISDRLRRRISRQGGATAATATAAATATTAQTPNQNPDDQQSTRHKTILVNAKTGQVISRN